jgi:hypothetical protein
MTFVPRNNLGVFYEKLVHRPKILAEKDFGNVERIPLRRRKKHGEKSFFAASPAGRAGRSPMAECPFLDTCRTTCGGNACFPVEYLWTRLTSLFNEAMIGGSQQGCPAALCAGHRHRIPSRQRFSYPATVVLTGPHTLRPCRIRSLAKAAFSPESHAPSFFRDGACLAALGQKARERSARLLAVQGD